MNEYAMENEAETVTECMVKNLSDCQGDDPFSGDVFPSDATDVIKFRFRKPEGGVITLCYYIEDIFEWVERQLITNPNKLPRTPSRNVLSQAQIDRLRACYFSRQNRRFQTPNDFEQHLQNNARANAEQQQQQQQQQQQRRIAASDYNVPSDQEIITQWLQELYPNTRMDNVEWSVISDAVNRWLQRQMGRYYERLSIIDSIEINGVEILEFLSSQYADLEIDPIILSNIRRLMDMTGLGFNRVWEALGMANNNYDNALDILREPVY
jgi:hypothetical protein